MRRWAMAVIGAVIVGVAACESGAPAMPHEMVSAAGATRQNGSVITCPAGYVPAGYQCMTATEEGGITADATVIGANCPEACDLHGGNTGLYVVPDMGAGWTDSIAISCPDPTGVVLLGSDFGCWDCQQSCAGTACPAGKSCLTIPGRNGSDCRVFSCSDQSYTLVELGTFTPPICARPGPPGAPNTSATTVNGNPSISWSAVSGAAYYRVYRQLEWMSQPDVWYSELHATSYTDVSTTVSGGPQGSTPSGKWALYYIVAVNAQGESGHIHSHYYPYTGIVPY